MATNEELEVALQDIIWLKERSVILIDQVDDVQQRLAAREATLDQHLLLPAHTGAAERISTLEAQMGMLNAQVQDMLTPLVNALIAKLI